jgi:hypothetical protein
MKVRLHLVIEQDQPDGQPDRRVDLTTTIDGGSPYGQDPVIGSIRAVCDLTTKAIGEVTR